ncbi:helix-turn-helix domain-containing protein [Aureimonas sp. AU40]|uniref:helix-turn-helix domain-containing protein n=1 Tax=Aureimonas sp. AU40 TaxID=1637747 RepID=UPI001FCD9B3E|nr:helix-turn-helix transcriptional regulator [Aureimonas sp. AU40]
MAFPFPVKDWWFQRNRLFLPSLIYRCAQSAPRQERTGARSAFFVALETGFATTPQRSLNELAPGGLSEAELGAKLHRVERADMTSAMDSDGFRQWRREMGLKQKDAADLLGLKKRVIQYYEKGDRDGKRVEIPRAVELACLALALGCDRYDGRRLPRSAGEIVKPPAPAAERAAE